VKNIRPTEIKVHVVWLALAGLIGTFVYGTGWAMYFDKDHFSKQDGGRSRNRPEAGRHYRTRDGRKAFVAALGREVDVADKCIGWIGPASCSWTEDGFYFADLVPNENDLVAAWDDAQAVH
jgi:hypothetical protein